MKPSKEVKKEVVKLLNEKYGKSLMDLTESIRIKNKYEQEVARIKAMLDLSNSNSSIVQTINDVKETVTEVDEVAEKADYVSEDLSSHLNETNSVVKNLKEHIKQLHELDTLMQYLKVVQYIEALCANLQKEIDKKDDEQCVTTFANISEVARQLATSKAIHLSSYLKETVLHWYNILKDKFAKEFTEVLKLIKWPFVNVNFSMEVPSEVNIQKLQILVEYLLQIDLPDELAVHAPPPSYLSDFAPLSLPVQLLIEPLRKRFLFHFYGTRKTNRHDKPEWYFTKILSWVRDHSEFMEKWVQPVVDKMGLYYIDVKTELMRGLVQLAVEKLYSDLPSLQYEDFTFSHCIDEALGFDKELKENYDYPLSQPGVLNVLTQAQVFIKWMSMEKKYATEKMDSMLLDPIAAFQPLDTDIEGLKIAPCADIFITLLQTITERYEVLPQPGHRLQFLELQLELLDDFRVRLLQLINAEEGDILNSKIPIIANTIFYIENVLEDWGAMVHFLNLFYYKEQLENPKEDVLTNDVDLNALLDLETDSVFADTLSLYRHMRKDLLMTITESVTIKIKASSKNYRYEYWSKLIVNKDIRSLSLTPSACPIFEVLANSLHKLEKYLTEKLFTYTWRSIAQHIDTFLFEDLVLENRFSEGGALQFKYDVTRNLFPLFSQYTIKPESYFVQLNESCILLNIAKGSALLLRETIIALEGATGVEDTRGKALKEIGVQFFTPKMSVEVLNRRADITVNRIVVD